MNNKELSTQSDKELNRLQQHNTQLQSQLNSLQEQLHNMKENYKNDSKDCDKMSTRSSARAHAHIPMTSLNKPAMTSLPKQASSFTQNATDESKVNELKLDLLQTRQELNRTKEALLGEYCSMCYCLYDEREMGGRGREREREGEGRGLDGLSVRLSIFEEI